MTGFFVFVNALLPVGHGNEDYLIWILNRAMIGLFMSGGGPNIQSLASDLLSKDEKSKFFGLISLVWSIAQVSALIISAFLFQYGYWRYYYLVCSILYFCLAIYILAIFKEPKRGIQEHALKEVVSRDDVTYTYKMDKETTKKVLFSRTNLLVFAEGIFSGIFFGVIDLVMLPYIQSSPRNISPSMTGLFMLLFGIPGAIIGNIFFARISDKYGKKDIKNRITLIIFSFCSAIILIILMFLIPLPALTKVEGNSVNTLWLYPIFFAFGIVIFFNSMLFSLFSMNQPVIIQEINLPEGQGTIRSLNQFVEIASYGAGPMIAGYLLITLNYDYLGVILRVLLIGIPGILMWIPVYWTITKDRNTITEILEIRAKELKQAADNRLLEIIKPEKREIAP